MKITQPPGRCVECYSRDLGPPEQFFPTTARFTPDPESLATAAAVVEGTESSSPAEKRRMKRVSASSSSRLSAPSAQVDGIVRWSVVSHPSRCAYRTASPMGGWVDGRRVY